MTGLISGWKDRRPTEEKESKREASAARWFCSHRTTVFLSGDMSYEVKVRRTVKIQFDNENGYIIVEGHRPQKSALCRIMDIAA